MRSFVKRLVDILISLLGITTFLPIWLALIILIKLDSKGPLLYLHKRIGINGKEFTCLKFRSMYVGSDPNSLVQDSKDTRVTGLGNFLRKTSLDETPQLLNVLFGDMSIVGPRPALPSQVEKFSKGDFDKLLVKPGLTGWTQVNGRNSLSYEKRMELDCWYANNWGLFLDFKILVRTLFVLLKQDGIYDAK